MFCTLELLARESGSVVGGLDDFEVAVDVHVLELSLEGIPLGVDVHLAHDELGDALLNIGVDVGLQHGDFGRILLAVIQRRHDVLLSYAVGCVVLVRVVV